MMKRHFNQSYGLLALAAIIALSLTACQQDETITDIPGDETTDTHTVEMVLQAGRPSFEADVTTRADAATNWADGSKVYLQLDANGAAVRGEATYSAAAAEWTLTYTGSLPNGIGTGEAYYMENARTTNTGLEFTTSTVVYQDLGIQYSFDGSRLVVAATLTPKTGRMRFRGKEGQIVFVKGLQRYDGYNAGRNTFTTTDLPLMLTVTENVSDGTGYTPYVYGMFTDSETRQVVVSGTSSAYRQTFPATVLQAGESGYVDIPTDNATAGWQQVDPFAGLIIPDSISETRAKVISEYIDAMAKVTSRQYNFSADEKYPVIVSPFFMAKYEVTQKLYKAVMNRDFVGYSASTMGDDLPVYLYSKDGNYENDEYGTRQDIKLPSEGYGTYISKTMREFVVKLNLLTNLHFDYPTEAEWEYAARGGQNMTGYYSYAGTSYSDYTNVSSGNGSNYGVTTVGIKQPNELGIYDMTGNVSEVCYYIGNNLTAGSVTFNPQCFGGNYCWRGGNNYDMYMGSSSYGSIANRTQRYNTYPQYGGYYGLRLIVRYLDM